MNYCISICPELVKNFIQKISRLYVPFAPLPKSGQHITKLSNLYLPGGESHPGVCVTHIVVVGVTVTVSVL